MKSSKLVSSITVLLTIIVIAAVIEADNGRETSRSRTGDAETSLRGVYSHRGDPHRHRLRGTQALRVRRPNETPIRPGTPARRPAVVPNPPKASVWGGPRSSQAQRELLFVSPGRFMQTRPRTAGTNPRGGHSTKVRSRVTSQRRMQGMRPNECPSTSRSAARRPPATHRPALEGSAQRELVFVSPKRFMQRRGRPRTMGTNPRRGHSRASPQGTNFGRMQASERRRKNRIPMRSAPRIHLVLSDYTPEPQSSSAVIRILT